MSIIRSPHFLREHPIQDTQRKPATSRYLPAGQALPNVNFEGCSFSGHVYMDLVHLPLADYTGITLKNVIELVHFSDQMPGRIFFLSALEYVKQELDRVLRRCHANLVEVIVVWSDSPGWSRSKSDSNHTKQGFLNSFKNL